ncbi:UNVERIFIED_CONTAM: hypothetical protein HDU68_000586 [Siphonaria sp. JEL0065]|nr:hypothetical protein HDU68_000586 [Siphonaria sp. JEL0065]
MVYTDKKVFGSKKRDAAANNLTSVNEYTASAGQRVSVCTIDTGVDYTHPDLGGCFGEGCRVSFGYDFAGTSFNPPNISTPSPKLLPMDCNGHGTHVAGIIMAIPVNASSPVGVGIAPKAMFGAYKVFGCTGGTNSALIIAAMDRAYKDGCTIVNLSLGTSDEMEDSPESVSASKLAEYGLVLVVAAGNSQEMGAFRIASPANSNGVMAVGSVDNTKTIGRTISIEGDETAHQIPFSYLNIPPLSSSDGKVKASEPLNAQVLNDGCIAYPVNFFVGFIALIHRGNCTFAVKVKNANDAGATSVIFYNTDNEVIGNIVNPFTNVSTFTISSSSGEYLIQKLQTAGNGNVGIRFGQTNVEIAVKNGGRISGFSSWGFSTDWDIKPDIVAPGGAIYSTYPMNMGRYAVLSGTSMASPHMAGIYALAISNNNSAILGTHRLDIVNTLIKTTSIPVGLPSSTLPDFGYAPVALQGNGLVNIVNITTATTFIYPATLLCKVNPWSNASDGEPVTGYFPVEITNVDNVAHSYIFSYIQAAHVSTHDLLSPQIFASLPNSTIVGLPSKVTVGVNKSETVTVSVRGPSRESMSRILKNSSAWFFSGWIQVTDDSGKRYTLAYGGTVGDFEKFAPIDTVKNTPYLGTYFNLGAPRNDNKHISILFPTTSVPPNPNSTLTFDVFIPTWVNSTTSGLVDDIVQQVETALLGSRIPKGCVAISQGVQAALSDATDMNHNLYNELVWDGSFDFNGKAPMAPPGEYYIVFVAEGVYGEFGDVSLWASQSFRLDRSADLNKTLRKKETLKPKQ